MFDAAHSQESDSSDIGYLDKKPKRRYFDFNVEKSDDNNHNKCSQHNFSIPELFSLKNQHSNESKFIPPITFPDFLPFNFIHFFLSFTGSIKSFEDLKFENKQITTLLEHLPMIVYMKDKNRNFITGSKHSRQFVNEGIDPYAANIKLEMSIAEESIKLDDLYVLQNKKLLVKEKSITDNSGNIHWYKVFKAPILTNTNTVQGLITIVQNIDAEKNIDAQKELYLATLTHDLKNPIQAQLSSLKLFESGLFGPLNKEQADILRIIIESASFMQDMLYSLLETYKYDNGYIHLSEESFHIDGLLETCINESGALAKDKEIKILYSSKLKDNEKFLCVDKCQFRRVVTNFLNNSINYAFKRTTIEICTYINDEKFIFTIKNCSPKIPEDLREHIFDKYVSSDKIGCGGIGLGLYFCKKFIEAYNGNIYVDSDEENTEFTFEIPLKNGVNCFDSDKIIL